MSKNLISSIVLAILLTGCGNQQAQTPAQDSAPQTAPDAPQSPPVEDVSSGYEISASGLAQHIAVLASDEFEGRAPTTQGGAKTRAYIAEQYERIGLQPIGESFFHTVPMVESTLDPEASSLTIKGPDGASRLAYREDAVYWTKQAKDEVSFQDSELVFVGYGVVAPEFGWDDYAGLDVTGKTVVILVNDPGFASQDPDLFKGNAMTYYGRWTYKFEEAARQGAAGALIVHETAPAAYGWGVVQGSWSGAQLDLVRDNGGSDRAILEGWLSLEMTQKLFADAGLNYETEKAAALSRDFTPKPMTGLSASATLQQDLNYSEDANVIGYLPGTQKPDEYVLLMGHWDHLGANARTLDADKIYNGAVDNATGVAAILEIAEKFASNEAGPRRSILVAAVTAEESGLLGSAYMAASPPVPLKQVVAGINIDAILPTPPAKDVVVVGYGASELEDILKEAASKQDRYLRPDPEPQNGYFYRSDHIELAKTGVPMLYADSGTDLRDGGEAAGKRYTDDYLVNRYHKPADEFSQEWDLSGMSETVSLLYEVGEDLAYGDRWPNWYPDNEFRAARDAQRAAP